MTSWTGRATSGRGAPGRPRVPRTERQQQMIEAATELFSERGFAAVSMDDVAKAAGITKPLIYSYFGSKEGLFAACAEGAGSVLRGRLRDLVEGSELEPGERLWIGIATVFEFVDHHRRSWALLYPAHGRPVRPVADGADRERAAMESLLGSLFADTARDAGIAEQAIGQVEPLARAFTAATIAMATDWVRRSEEPRELAALRLMNLAWVGFGGLLEGRMWLPEGDHLV